MMNFTMIRHDSMLMRFQRVYGKITLIKDYEFSNNCVSEPIISSFFIGFFGFFFVCRHRRMQKQLDEPM